MAGRLHDFEDEAELNELGRIEYYYTYHMQCDMSMQSQQTGK